MFVTCKPASPFEEHQFIFNQKPILLDFINTIDDSQLSVLDYHYLYNGGGVGIADFNKDGHKDIFVGGNMVSCSLFLGDGKLNFEKQTEQAGITTDAWVNGVALVDINHDGLMDIYLSVGGPDCTDKKCQNLLYINKTEDQKTYFEEQSHSFGLDIPHYSQQGIFFDADLDGDLDLYQLQNYVDPTTKNYPKPKQYFSKKSYDKILINQEAETGEITFVDKSSDWNVRLPGFGLGAICSDFNNDGFPDLYIANDFISDDILYINKEGKSFEDQSKKYLKHTSYNSMGVDFGDLNGDTFEEIMVLDMLPTSNYRQKTMLGSMNYDKFLLSQKEGYNKQFIRNTLQLHPGSNPSESNPFTDVSAYSNVHQTDWSWSPLIADFDNDGSNDIYISNGYGKNITDLDFVNYNSNLVGFGDKSEIEKKLKEDINQLPDVKLKNLFFHNQGQLQFDKYAFSNPSITNGVAYADLDNDGDLDLVQNNLNEATNILVNQTQGNYIKVQLIGSELNPNAIGATVIVSLSNGKTLKKLVYPTRAYLSTMDQDLIFGLGDETVESVEVIWPDQRTLHREDIDINKAIIFEWSEDLKLVKINDKEKSVVTKDILIEKTSTLNSIHDFSIQSLLFKSCLDESIVLEYEEEKDIVFIANAQNELLKYDLKNEKESPVLKLDGLIVTDMLIHDLKGKGQNQFYLCVYDPIVSKTSSIIIIDNFERNWESVTKLPLDKSIYKLMLANDLLYTYGAADADAYPKFKDGQMHQINFESNVFSLGASLVQDYGSISKAIAADLDQDGRSEIVMLGEWQAPKIYTHTDEGLTSKTFITSDSLYGFWQSVDAFDLDKDGDLDLVLSNIGANTRLKANYGQPLELLASDIDENGKIDPIMSLANIEKNESFTYASRDDIVGKVPAIKKQYKDYASFAQQDYQSIIKSIADNPQFLKINFLKSIVLENKGNLKFVSVDLPYETQLSLANGFEVIDVNHDGLEDLFMFTNYEAVEVHNGSIDGLNGLLLKNNGNLAFESMSAADFGFDIREQIKNVVYIGQSQYLVSTSKAVYKIKT